MAGIDQKILNENPGCWKNSFGKTFPKIESITKRQNIFCRLGQLFCKYLMTIKTVNEKIKKNFILFLKLMLLFLLTGLR